MTYWQLKVRTTSHEGVRGAAGVSSDSLHISTLVTFSRIETCQLSVLEVQQEHLAIVSLTFNP